MCGAGVSKKPTCGAVDHLLSFTKSVTRFRIEDLLDSPRVSPINVPVICKVKEYRVSMMN